MMRATPSLTASRGAGKGRLQRPSVFSVKRLATRLVALPVLFSLQALAVTEPDPYLSSRIEQVVKASGASIDGQRAGSSDLLDDFYRRTGFRAVWVGERGLTKHGLALVGVLGGAQGHGLDTRDYHLPAISARIAELQAANPEDSAALELLMTDGALTYARHLSRGKVSPEILYDNWKARPRKRNVVSTVRAALEGSADGLAAAFDALAPRDPRYRQLKVLLLELKRSIGEPVPNVPRKLLRLEDRGPAVAVLRQRLAAWEGKRGGGAYPEIFDIPLEARVRQFQHRHGLEPDGIVGEKTIAWLNKTYAERMRQVRVNMERWRWMPADLGQRRIEVNIAGYRVDVMEDGRKVLSMRAIVGKPYHKTPVFSERMSYLVFNPSWNVPWSIAVNELLPTLQKNPSYLSEENMRVLSGWGYDAEVIDAGKVDWASMNRDNFRYRFQQLPGENNALGRVKFMFPNEFNVYLHDTSARGLFTNEARGFSHGCVRLEKPMDLARYLLQFEQSWTRERLDGVLESGRETEVPVRSRIPVHFMYWTVWIDESGRPQFRDDVYDRDEPLAAALIDGQES